VAYVQHFAFFGFLDFDCFSSPFFFAFPRHFFFCFFSLFLWWGFGPQFGALWFFFFNLLFFFFIFYFKLKFAEGVLVWNSSFPVLSYCRSARLVDQRPTGEPIYVYRFPFFPFFYFLFCLFSCTFLPPSPFFFFFSSFFFLHPPVFLRPRDLFFCENTTYAARGIATRWTGPFPSGGLFLVILSFVFSWSPLISCVFKPFPVRISQHRLSSEEFLYL